MFFFLCRGCELQHSVLDVLLNERERFNCMTRSLAHKEPQQDETSTVAQATTEVGADALIPFHGGDEITTVSTVETLEQKLLVRGEVVGVGRQVTIHEAVHHR